MALRVVGGEPPKRRPFKEHKHARALYAAIHLRPASSYKEAAQRMTEAEGELITVGAVNGCIHHIKRNSQHYTWTIPPLPRGIGTDHQLRAVRLEDDKRVGQSDYSRQCNRRGALSALKTLDTLSTHDANAYDALASAHNLTRAEARAYMRTAERLRATADFYKQMLQTFARDA